MQRPPTAFILAGEASGDRLGADLMQRAAAKFKLEWIGVGGAEMCAAGLTSIFPMSNLSVMGMADVLKRLPLIFWRISQSVRYILAQDPDLVVLIDSQDFSKRVAKRLRAQGYSKPIILYVAPTVWLYAPKRALEYAKLFDEILTILPFEPQLLRDLGGPHSSYIGHPSIRQPALSHEPATKTPLVALYPGSRAGELKRHLNMLRDVAVKLNKEHGPIEFFVPTIGSTHDKLVRETAQWPVSVHVSSDRAWRQEKLAAAHMAITVSGTATLEIAVAGVPMVSTYVMDFAQASRRKELGKIRTSLPNVILGADNISEILLDKPDADFLYKNAQELFLDDHMRANQSAEFERMMAVMQKGEESEKKQDPEDRILHWLEKQSS